MVEKSLFVLSHNILRWNIIWKIMRLFCLNRMVNKWPNCRWAQPWYQYHCKVRNIRLGLLPKRKLTRGLFQYPMRRIIMRSRNHMIGKIGLTVVSLCSFTGHSGTLCLSELHPNQVHFTIPVGAVLTMLAWVITDKVALEAWNPMRIQEKRQSQYRREDYIAVNHMK